MLKKNKNALIGYTGFIGSNLKKIKNNIEYFNSKNINKIKNKKYKNIICAGTYSKIWLAKKNPKKDKKNINYLIKSLKTVEAEKFFLISTCEIYGKQKNTFENSKIKVLPSYAYGYNRHKLEKFVESNFEKNYLIRLPIVYGKNFSKNFLFDLINNKNIENLNGNDLVQIYNVSNLKKHINYVEKKNIRKLNISSKPIKLKKIAKKIFKIHLNNKNKFREINIKSLYGKNNGCYFLSEKKTWQDLKNFLKYKI